MKTLLLPPVRLAIVQALRACWCPQIPLCFGGLHVECELLIFPLSLLSSILPWFNLASVVDNVGQDSPIALTVLLPL